MIDRAGAAMADTAATHRPPTAGPRALAARWHADRYLVVLLALFVVSLPLVTHRVYASDEVQYFAYLRSVWFDRDLDFTNEYTYFIDRYPEALAGFKKTNLDRLSDRGTPTGPPTGLPQNFGPIGSAVLWTPFYAIGHLVALAWHAVNPAMPADGFSPPYIWAITTGSAVLTAVALLLLNGLARQFTHQAAAFWATLGIWLGTPVIFYSHGAPAYSHAASLFAVTAFLVVWHRTRPLMTRRARHWLALGLLAALVTMVREQDGIIPIVVLAAEAFHVAIGLVRRKPAPHPAQTGELVPDRRAGQSPQHWGNERGAASALLRPLAGAVLLGVAWLIAFTPQLAAYWILNGEFRPNQNVTDKMLSLVPRWAFTVVFSPEYGLAFWTPLVVPAVLGLAWLWRRDRVLTLALVFIFLATWYITAVYNTGPSRGSFGARRFLNCTPVFLLGLAAAYQALAARRLAVLAPLVTGLGIWWNLGLIVQFAFNLMDRQRLDLGLILYNQFVAVPTRLLDIAQRLLFARDTLYRG